MADHEWDRRGDDRRIGRMEEAVENLQRDVGQLKQIVIDGDGPDNPSLVTALAVFNGKLDVLNATARLIVRTIIMALILLLSNEFFGPTIRHMLHIPDASSTASPSTNSANRPAHALLPYYRQ